MGKLKITENIKYVFKKINLSYAGIITRENAFVHPWTVTINISLKINTLLKEYTEPHIYRQDFLQIRDNYNDYTEIYTDGPKSDKRVGAARHLKNVKISQ